MICTICGKDKPLVIEEDLTLQQKWEMKEKMDEVFGFDTDESPVYFCNDCWNSNPKDIKHIDDEDKNEQK